VHVARQGHALRGRADGRRAWWTRERVLAGLVAYHAATGQTPTTSRYWAGLVRSLGALSQHPRHYPSEYAVLRHFPSFRAAWEAVGVQLDDAHWAPWTASDDSYLVTHLGVEPTASIAVTLRRGEAAVRTRARKLGLCVGLAHGWPLLRVARTAHIAEYVLRGYIGRGELAAPGADEEERVRRMLLRVHQRLFESYELRASERGAVGGIRLQPSR